MGLKYFTLYAVPVKGAQTLPPYAAICATQHYLILFLVSDRNEIFSRNRTFGFGLRFVTPWVTLLEQPYCKKKILINALL